MSARTFFVGVDAENCDDWDRVWRFEDVRCVSVRRQELVTDGRRCQRITVSAEGEGFHVPLYTGFSEEQAQAIQQGFLDAWGGGTASVWTSEDGDPS